MEAISIERQVGGDVNKFYLDTLRWLQVDEKMDGKCEDFNRFYCGVRDMVNPNTHFNTLDKLGPSLLYVFLKTRGILIVLPDFLGLYQLKYHKFTTNLNKVLKLCPDFNKRDKKSISKKFMETILKSFSVNQSIIAQAGTLFEYFYPLIQYTKEEIVAAAVCALTTISFDLREMSMRLICDRAGICQSALNVTITNKIFPYLGIPSNFRLKASFELIKGKIRKKVSLEEIKVRTIENIKVTKKIVNRTKRAKRAHSKPYNSPRLIGRFYSNLLKKIRADKNKKIPLSKLSYLLLRHEARVKKNISKVCRYLSKANVSRTNETILGLVIKLSFLQTPRSYVTNLVGVSQNTIKNNVAIIERMRDDGGGHLNLVIKEQINLESIFEYFAIIVSLINEGELALIGRPKALESILNKVPQVRTTIHNITKILTGRGLYRDEVLILATAMFISCPSLNKKTIKQIITLSVNRKVKTEQIEVLQKVIGTQETLAKDQLSITEQLGDMVEERETDVLCAKCGKFVFLQIYPNNKKIFACKHCLIQ